MNSQLVLLDRVRTNVDSNRRERGQPLATEQRWPPEVTYEDRLRRKSAQNHKRGVNDEAARALTQTAPERELPTLSTCLPMLVVAHWQQSAC
ncbi:hypothetical protein [Micromonospora carbonacea]|uniref:Uncharacterized protein n=1 Tax=Micromonospora carbonacea TaxID=47853 RepID=A0A1C4TX35_9ACTN|nr:hypothetical protein [Micromonospora carbonacea]SCE64012.1 hypothetical protein GA0070563_10159 [Micromonospora carbonacea]